MHPAFEHCAPLMNLPLYLLFLLTGAVTVLTPGPGVLMTIMRSMQYGYRGAVWTICGTSSGTIIMACISGTGIGFLLSHSPEAYGALRVLGAVYMSWLGIRSWRTQPPAIHAAVDGAAPSADEPQVNRLHACLEGVTLQMTNPMLIMFFISLFPQFIDPNFDYARQFAILTGSYFALVFIIHSGYSLTVTHFRGALANRGASRIIYRIGGTLFLLLSAQVFLSVLWG